EHCMNAAHRDPCSTYYRDVTRWSRLSEELGGELQPRTGWARLSPWSWEIGFQRPGRPIRLRIAPGLDAQALWRFRFVARHLLPDGPTLRLLREGTVRMWLRQFGYQDIELGHAAFDFRYTVKGHPASEVRCVLEPVADDIVAL